MIQLSLILWLIAWKWVCMELNGGGGIGQILSIYKIQSSSIHLTREEDAPHQYRNILKWHDQRKTGCDKFITSTQVRDLLQFHPGGGEGTNYRCQPAVCELEWHFLALIDSAQK